MVLGSINLCYVFFERRNQLELEDLLKTLAEMLGKGSLGTVYKAVLDDGSTTVAVKRLKDANPCPRKEFEQYMEIIGRLKPCPRKEFEQYMEIIGRLKHQNVVKLRAYYHAKEEKLLVYEHLPNGSLHSLLHGNQGPGRIPLDWTTRISLMLGAARGLPKIHDEYIISKIPHGNIKSPTLSNRRWKRISTSQGTRCLRRWPPPRTATLDLVCRFVKHIYRWVLSISRFLLRFPICDFVGVFLVMFVFERFESG